MLTDGHSIPKPRGENPECPQPGMSVRGNVPLFQVQHENCQPLLLTIPKDQVLNIQQLPKCLPTLALLNPLSGLLK